MSPTDDTPPATYDDGDGDNNDNAHVTPRRCRALMLRLLGDAACTLAQLSCAVQFVHDPTRALCAATRSAPFPAVSHDTARRALLAAAAHTTRPSSHRASLTARATALSATTQQRAPPRGAVDAAPLGYSAYWRLFGNLPMLYEAHAQLVLLLCDSVDALASADTTTTTTTATTTTTTSAAAASLAIATDFFCSPAMQLYVAEHVMYTTLYAKHGAHVLLQLARACRAPDAANRYAEPHAYARFLDLVAHLHTTVAAAAAAGDGARASRHGRTSACALPTLPMHAGAARAYYSHNATLRNLHTVLLLLATPLPTLRRCVQCARCLVTAACSDGGACAAVAVSATRLQHDFVEVAMRQLNETHASVLECVAAYDAQAVVRQLNGAYVLDTDARQRHRDVKAALSAYVMRQLHGSDDIARTAASPSLPSSLTGGVVAVAMSTSTSRALLHYGRLYKRFRRGTHERLVFLFSDCCCHVEELARKRLRVRGALPLAAVTRVVDVVGATSSNAFELHTNTSVAFTFYADTPEQKRQWLDVLHYALRQWRQRQQQQHAPRQAYAAGMLLTKDADRNVTPLSPASRLQRQQRRDMALQQCIHAARRNSSSSSTAATAHAQDVAPHASATDTQNKTHNMRANDANKEADKTDATAADAKAAGVGSHDDVAGNDGSSRRADSDHGVTRMPAAQTRNANEEQAATTATHADETAVVHVAVAAWSTTHANTALRHIRTASSMSLPHTRPHSSRQSSTPRNASARLSSAASSRALSPSSRHSTPTPPAASATRHDRDYVKSATQRMAHDAISMAAASEGASKVATDVAEADTDETVREHDVAHATVDNNDNKAVASNAIRHTRVGSRASVASLLSAPTSPHTHDDEGDSASDSDISGSKSRQQANDNNDNDNDCKASTAIDDGSKQTTNTATATPHDNKTIVTQKEQQDVSPHDATQHDKTATTTTEADT